MFKKRASSPEEGVLIFVVNNSSFHASYGYILGALE